VAARPQARGGAAATKLWNRLRQLRRLTKIDYKNPPQKLIIAEGVETALAMMQLTGLPAIATAGKVSNVNPPVCTEYIIAVDVDDDGGSRGAAGELAARMVVPGSKLTFSTARLSTPTRPEAGKSGYDWDDALQAAKGNKAKLEKLARSIREAPTFEQVQSKQEKREAKLNKLAASKLKNPTDYEDARKAAFKELDWRPRVLDEEVQRRVDALKAEAEAERTKKPEATLEQLAESAREIIACKDVLAMFDKDCGRVIAGESVTVQLAYLVGTSRLFDNPINMVFKGPSAGGKSRTCGAVLDYFPPESVVRFTALSEKALLYYAADFQNKILFMGEAAATEDAKFQNYLLRELMSEGKLRYPVPMKVEGRIETVTIEKDGPVAFMVTTTKNSLDQENETRMLSVEIDDSKAQTERVLRKIAVVEGLNRKPPETDRRRWHDFQRWLAAGETRVVVPFALTLSNMVRGTKSVRLRRDFGQLLNAIKAHALLHRESRTRSDRGEIVATIGEDYTIVRQLMGDMLAASAELKLRKEILQTIEAVEKITAELPTNKADKGVTTRDIGNLLNLDRTATWRRVRAAENAGYLKNLEERKGHAGRFVCTGETLVSGGNVLPKPTDLEAEWAREVERDGREGEKSLNRATP
jgi:hypothetical protein